MFWIRFRVEQYVCIVENQQSEIIWANNVCACFLEENSWTRNCCGTRIKTEQTQHMYKLEDLVGDSGPRKPLGILFTVPVVELSKSEAYYVTMPQILTYLNFLGNFTFDEQLFILYCAVTSVNYMFYCMKCATLSYFSAFLLNHMEIYDM